MEVPGSVFHPIPPTPGAICSSTPCFLHVWMAASKDLQVSSYLHRLRVPPRPLSACTAVAVVATSVSAPPLLPAEADCTSIFPPSLPSRRCLPLCTQTGRMMSLVQQAIVARCLLVVALGGGGSSGGSSGGGRDGVGDGADGDKQHGTASASDVGTGLAKRAQVSFCAGEGAAERGGGTEGWLHGML